MAKVGVNLKIDVTKIDKSKLFSGQKGTYLDAQVFIDIDQFDQYGNSGMITQAVSKEDREAGQQGAILGNAKVFWKDNQQSQHQGGWSQPQQQQQQQKNHGGHQQQQPPQQMQKQPPQQQYQNQGQPQDFDDSIPF